MFLKVREKLLPSFLKRFWIMLCYVYQIKPVQFLSFLGNWYILFSISSPPFFIKFLFIFLFYLYHNSSSRSNKIPIRAHFFIYILFLFFYIRNFDLQYFIYFLFYLLHFLFLIIKLGQPDSSSYKTTSRF